MDAQLLKLKIKKYLAQYEYLLNEYEETEYLFEKYKKVFYNECPKKVFDKNNQSQPNSSKNAHENNADENNAGTNNSQSQSESQNSDIDDLNKNESSSVGK